MRIDHSIRPELNLDAAAIVADCGCDDHASLVGDLEASLDERTIRYVLETRPHFEDLRQAVGQLGGMLVLAAAGAKSVTPDHPLFATARETLGRASDGIRSALPSARGMHHHRHLVAAIGALGLALEQASADMHLTALKRASVEAVLQPLQRAYRQLAWAAKALPGFEIVSFDQACCAPQGPTTRPATSTPHRTGRNIR